MGKRRNGSPEEEARRVKIRELLQESNMQHGGNPRIIQRDDRGVHGKRVNTAVSLNTWGCGQKVGPRKDKKWDNNIV